MSTICGLAERSDNTRSFLRAALAELRAEAGSDTATFMPGSAFVPDALGDLVTVDQEPRVLAQLCVDMSRYEPEMGKLLEAHQGTKPFIDTELLSDGERASMRLYRELIEPEGIISIMACPLTFRGARRGTVFLGRRRGRERFAPSELERITALLPVFTLAEVALESQRPRQDEEDDVVVRFRDAFYELSQREQQIAQLIGRSLQNKEIAQLLGTSPHTVRKQTVQVFKKLGVPGRTQVALLVQRAGLTPTCADRLSG